MGINWNWGIFFEQAPFGNTTYLGWLWSGLQTTLAVSVCARIIAFFVGSFSAFCVPRPTVCFPPSAPVMSSCSAIFL